MPDVTNYRCSFKQNEHGWWICITCGYVYKRAIPRPPVRSCGSTHNQSDAQRLTGEPTPQSCGPGTELLKLLKMPVAALKWLPYVSSGGCENSCERCAQEMDRWGVAGCREQFTKIVNHLEYQAKKLNMPFNRRVAEMFVRLAIRRAEKKERLSVKPPG